MFLILCVSARGTLSEHPSFDKSVCQGGFLTSLCNLNGFLRFFMCTLNNEQASGPIKRDNHSSLKFESGMASFLPRYAKEDILKNVFWFIQ